MKIHQSIKQTNLEERRPALYDQIRLLGIKSLDISSPACAEDSGKATLDRISPIRISGLDQYSQIMTPQLNIEIHDF